MKTFIKVLVASIIIILLLSCKEEGLTKDKPEGLITLTEANMMRALYLKNQFRYINNGFKSEFETDSLDFNEVSFDLKDFKKYIALIEKLAKENNYPEENLGIRVQLGAKYDENKIPRTNVFFAPIYKPRSDKNIAPKDYEIIEVLSPESKSFALTKRSAYYNKGSASSNPK